MQKNKNTDEEKNFRPIVKNLFLILSVIGFLYAIIFSLNNLDKPHMINIVIVLPFILFMIPYLMLSLFEIKKVESKMQVVPRFFRDVVDNVDSGMDLVSSIKSTTKNEYSVLNYDVLKLSNQLSWGIDFDKAVTNFANNVGSTSLKRDLLLVIEARKVGGHVEKILRELSLKINNENLRVKERKSNLASNTFTGYISFIIFIFIIILVYNNLFVELISNSEMGGEGAQTSLDTYLSLFMLLTYELSILSGFLFGLMQENNILSGAPHVVALVILSFIGFFFFV